MGMFSLDHLEVHLRNIELRRRGGLRPEVCLVAAECRLLERLPPRLAALCEVVPQAHIRELLGTTDDRYCAVLSNWKGSANSALVVQEVLAYLERAHPARFELVDDTHVERIVLGATDAELHACGQVVKAGRVVLCTNGFVNHVIENPVGDPIDSQQYQRVHGRIGYMAALADPQRRAPAAYSYLFNEIVGGALPYAYVAHRTHDLPKGAVTLTAMGGPERELAAGEHYDAGAPFPEEMLDEMDRHVRPLAQTSRPAGVGIRLPMARSDGVHPRSDPIDRARTAQPGALVQPRLQWRGVSPRDLWR
jgi:hypothetical protein